VVPRPREKADPIRATPNEDRYPGPTNHFSLLTSHFSQGASRRSPLPLPVTFELDVERYLLFLDTGAQFFSAKLVV
jgi:hypothetical protein